MELQNVPHKQLLAIFKCSWKEIKRRKKAENLWREFKPILRTFEEQNPEIFEDIKIKEEVYKKSFSRLPDNILKDSPNTRVKFFPYLVAQDWSNLFQNKDFERRYYVYAHIDPTNKFIVMPKEFGGMHNIPFYVGKGTGNRAYDLNRNQGHGVKLSELKKRGITHDKIVKIIKRDLTEAEALELEAKLIYFYGTIYEKNRNGVLVNLDIPPMPNFSLSSTIQVPKKQKKIKEIE